MKLVTLSNFMTIRQKEKKKKNLWNNKKQSKNYFVFIFLVLFKGISRLFSRKDKKQKNIMLLDIKRGHKDMM